MPEPCTCPSRLMDYVRRIVGHPYLDCPYHGTTTRMDDGVSDE